jgi:hypothetical protein
MSIYVRYKNNKGQKGYICGYCGSEIIGNKKKILSHIKAHKVSFKLWNG